METTNKHNTLFNRTFDKVSIFLPSSFWSIILYALFLPTVTRYALELDNIVLLLIGIVYYIPAIAFMVGICYCLLGAIYIIGMSILSIFIPGIA